MTEVPNKYGAKGLAWVKVVDGELNGPVAKVLDPSIQGDLTNCLGLEDKDLVLFVADTLEVANVQHLGPSWTYCQRARLD